MSKINPKFKLKDRKSKQRSLIIMKIYYRTKRYTYSTSEKIDPDYWDEKSGRAVLSKVSAELPAKLKAEIKAEINDINNSLNNCDVEAVRAFDHFSTQKIIPTAEQFKNEMDKALNRKPEADPEKEIDFFSFTEDYIEQTKVLRTGGTVRGYRDTFNKLKNFQKSTGYKVDFNTINLNFYGKFVKYLVDIPIGMNTIGEKHIKNLKAFVHAAERRGITINKQIDDPQFKKLSGETDKIYLTEDEVKRLYEFDLSNNKRLETIRDMFIIGCKTAKRYGDYSAVKKQHIKEIEGKFFIDMRMDKGDGRVVVPLSNVVIEILKKYNYNLPRPISNQKANEYLKELGKLVGFDEEVIHAEYPQLKRVDVVSKKYELMVTHTARRTGATNMYLAGIPAQSIMKLTGHKTEKEFMRYIRADEQVHAMHMAKNAFFDD